MLLKNKMFMCMYSTASSFLWNLLALLLKWKNPSATLTDFKTMYTVVG